MKSIVEVHNKRQKINIEFRDVMLQAIMNCQVPTQDNRYRTEFLIKGQRYLATLTSEEDGNNFVIIEHKCKATGLYRPVAVKNKVDFLFSTLIFFVKDFIIDQLVTKENFEGLHE